MVEIIAALFVLLLLLGLFVGIFGLPLFLVLRATRQVAELKYRLDQLERELQARTVGEMEAVPAETVEAAEPIAGAIAAETTSALAHRPRLPSLARLGQPLTGGFDLEAWIGRRGLGWAAVVLLLFATAFFLKYAFENEWVGELGRVAIGILAGVGLSLGGLVYHRRGWRLFSQMATAGGVVLLYLATFGAFGYYQLLPSQQAAVFLVILIAEVAALAVLYEAPAIAFMALLGGLLNPLLLRTEHDQYRSLFVYFTLLNTGVVGLALFRRWRGLGTLALAGTQALFWVWYAANYHPEKWGAAVAFQVATFALLLAHSLLTHVLRPRTATIEDLIRLVLNAFFLAIAAFVLLDKDYHLWMGTLAVILAILYTALGWLVLRRRPEDQRQLLVVVSVALAFIAVAFPLQASAAWIAVGWAVEALALWWFGLRIRSGPLRALAAVLLLVAVGRLVLVDTPFPVPRGRFVPLFNRYGLPATAIAVCAFAAAAASRHFASRLTLADRWARAAAAVAGVGLGWLVLSKETYDFCVASFNPRSAETALSGIWATYAGLLLAVGFRLQSGPLRWSALALFGVTLAKVVLIDMSALPGFYRVTAFLVLALALVMAAAAWGYQKFQLRRLAGRWEENKHEPA